MQSKWGPFSSSHKFKLFMHVTLRVKKIVLQVSNTVLYFSDVLWPEFTIWNLLVAIIHFQRYAPPPKEVKFFSGEKQQFLDKLDDQRLKQLEKYVNC